MDPTHSYPARWRDLGLLLLLALIPRLLWLSGTELLVAEGTEYAQLARNLLAGEGYVGGLAGRQLMFPPGYPLAIAGVMGVSGCDAATAARALSLLASLALVAIVHGLAHALSGRRAALICGVLAALLPGLVLAGASAFSESLQLALVLGAIALLLPLARRGAPRTTRGALGRATLAGCAFGCAFQVRVEALPLGIWAALLLTLAPGRRPVGWGARYLPGALLLLMLGVLMLPYALYLQDVTGRFSVAGKSDRVLLAAERYARGIPYFRANYEIDEQGRDVGPWLRPNAPWTGEDTHGVWKRSGGAILLHATKQAIKGALTYASGHTMGSLLFLLLALPVLAASRRRSETLFVDLWVLGAAAYGIAMYGSYKPVLRYLLPTAFASVLLAGRGLVAWERRRDRPLSPRLLAAVLLLLLLSASRGFVTGVREFGESRARHRPAREAGEFLARMEAESPLMASDPRLAYYAGRTWHPLPWAPTREAFERRAEAEGIREVAIERGATPGPWYDPEAPPWPPFARVGPVTIFRLR